MVLAPEFEVRLIFGRDIGNAQAGKRAINAFPILKGMVVLSGDVDFLFLEIDFVDEEIEVAVVDEDVVPGFDVEIEFLMGDGETVLVAEAVIHPDDHLHAGRDVDRPVFHETATDFGPLGIEGDGDVDALFLEVAGNLDFLELLGIIAMAEIDAHDVHAGFVKGEDHLGGVGSRPDGRDDFRFLGNVE